jgi:hypothetical protein
VLRTSDENAERGERRGLLRSRGAQRNPKKERTAMTTTTKPTM